MGYKVGDRVGAISHADKETVYLFGYGTYEGNHVPPQGVQFLGVDLASLGHTNPKITLDSGKVVWGCECWWGPEARVKAEIGGRKVVMVDIDKAREEAKK